MEGIINDLYKKTRDIFSECPDSIIDDTTIGELLYYATLEIKQLESYIDGLFIHRKDINNIRNMYDSLNNLYYVNYYNYDSVIAALAFIESITQVLANIITVCLSRYIENIKQSKKEELSV